MDFRSGEHNDITASQTTITVVNVQQLWEVASDLSHGSIKVPLVALFFQCSFGTSEFALKHTSKPRVLQCQQLEHESSKL